MNFIEITRDNVQDYSEYIGIDMSENLSRTFYRGLLARGDQGEPVSGIIWQLTGLDEGEDVKSYIEWFRTEDTAAAKELLDQYTKKISLDSVRRSSIVIPASMKGTEKQLLKEAGFSVRLTEGDDVVVSLSELMKIPLIRNKVPVKNVISINNMTVRSFKKTIGRCMALGKKGVCEDLEYLPMAYFDLDVSCYVQGTEDVSGIMLFHKSPSGIISISLMAALDQDFSKTIPGMMRYFAARCKEKYSPDTLIHFSRHNQSAFLLSEKLLPRGFGTPVYAGEREEYPT